MTSDPLHDDPCAGHDLVALAEGRLPDAAREALWVHLDGCASCAEVVAHLAGYQPARAALGRYQLRGVVGEGAMGVVHQAWDPQLQRRVAIKVVRPERDDAEAQARMVREAQALARVAHPNVVAVFDAGVDGDAVWVATELVDGEALATWQTGRAPAQIVDAWVQVGRGLAAAHAVGVVHRDVKASNCLVGLDGRVRVADFGLARVGAGASASAASPGAAADASAAALASTASAIVGTPAYMAPEQRAGRVDARADQYALCVSLAEALGAGRPGPEARPRVPALPAVEQVLARGLHRDPAARFVDMDALAAALAAASGASTSRRLSTRRVIGVGVLAGLGAGALAALLALGRAAPVSAPPCAPPRLPDADGAGVGVWSGPRLQAWRDRWQAAAAGVCAPDLDDDTRRRRRACLQAQADTLVGASTRGASAPTGAHLDELTRVDRCAHPAWAVVVPGWPAALWATASAAAARRVADPARPVAEAAPTAILTVAGLAGPAALTTRAQELAEAAAARGEPVAAAAVLTAAMRRLGPTGDAGARAQLLVTLSGVLADDVSGRGERVDADARAAVAAVGADPELDALLDFFAGSRAAARNDLAGAAEALTQARASFRAAYGGGSTGEALATTRLAGVYRAQEPGAARTRQTWDEARAMLAALGGPEQLPALAQGVDEQVHEVERLAAEVHEGAPGSPRELDAQYALANAYAVADRVDEARAAFERLVLLAEPLSIRDHRVVEALTQIASLHAEAGRGAAALPVAERAVAEATALGDPAALSSAQHMLGWARSIVGDAVGAVAPLEAAVAYRAGNGVPPQQRGHSRFRLAVALPASARARARALAQAARLDVDAFLAAVDRADPMWQATIRMYERIGAEIDAWLAAR